MKVTETASVVLWSEFMDTVSEVSGSIPGATRFSEKQLSLLRINEELLERKVAAPV
jgi:hypothetical protein